MKRAHVTAIADWEGLRGFEAGWTALHQADPQATIFTSWPWLVGRLGTLVEPWWVLIARSESDQRVLGFLPLRGRSKANVGELSVVTLLGCPFADYNGFLCLPKYDDLVLAAFACHVREALSWHRLELRDIRDPRLATFLAHFEQPCFTTHTMAPTPCPSVELEASWEGYLAARMNSRRRQTLRRKLRAIEKLPGLRISSVIGGVDGGDDDETQISTLLDLWQRRWGRRSELELAQFRSIFRRCLDSEQLWLDILWSGNNPLAGLLAFLDRKNHRFCFYISGYDEKYAEWSPGIVMVAHSLRQAIAMGFETYDFLRGDEPYKSSFGARLEVNENVDVERNDTRQ